MTRVMIFVAALIWGGMAGAQSGLTEKESTQLRQIADRIALIEPGEVPDLLVRALIAAEDPEHLNRAAPLSRMTLQVARTYLPAMQTLKRKASEVMLATYLGERLTPVELARVYAATVYYGRNCFGYEAAAPGLARVSPKGAPDEVWMALAALPRSPTWYLRDRVALRERVGLVIDEMLDANLIGKDSAERLRDLPIANLSVGKGC